MKVEWAKIVILGFILGVLSMYYFKMPGRYQMANISGDSAAVLDTQTGKMKIYNTLQTGVAFDQMPDYLTQEWLSALEKNINNTRSISSDNKKNVIEIHIEETDETLRFPGGTTDKQIETFIRDTYIPTVSERLKAK